MDRDLNRWTLRAAEACTGALGVIVGISIFTGIPGWGSAWLRLVVKDDDAAWSSSKEKGLAVVFLLFALIGSASDWYLARRYGADPAQVCSILQTEFIYCINKWIAEMGFVSSQLASVEWECPSRRKFSTFPHSLAAYVPEEG